MTYSVSLVLDANNNPHILYGTHLDFNGQNGSTTVKYAQWSNSSGWITQNVVANSLDGSTRNLALDSNGNPHFTYAAGYPEFKINNATLNYVSWNGTTWNDQEVASHLNFVQEMNYLALDSQNYPHIVYYNSTPNAYSGTLMYARWNGNTWSTQTVDSNSSLFAGPIVLDSNGAPHIAYCGQPATPSNYNAYVMYSTTHESIEPTPYGSMGPGATTPTGQLYILIIVPVLAVIIIIISVSIYLKKMKETRSKLIN